MLTITALAAGDWPRHRDLRLRSLADSPDAFGSTLADERQRSEQAWAQRLAQATVSGRDCPLIAQLDGRDAGLLWARADGDDDGAIVTLYQMWVAPECRGHGVAAALLDGAVQWATARAAGAVELGVTCGDTPAARLYARAGFTAVGMPQPLREGSALLSQTLRKSLR